MTEFLKKKNNAYGNFAGNVNASETEITMMDGDGARFPDSGNFEISAGREIMLVTGISGDVLTVLRGQNDTEAQDHEQGDTIELRITTKHMTDIEAAINALESAMALVATLTGVEQLENKTLVLPTIADLTNMQHNHTSADEGGLINIGSSIPTGAILPFGGDVLPEGYLWCQGGLASKATYPTLYSQIGDKYGTGDADNFRLPDKRDRSLVGASGTKAVGSKGGNATISLQHSHTVANHNHSVGAEAPGTNSAGGHSHTVGHAGNSVYSGSDSTPAYLAASRYAGHNCDSQGSHSHTVNSHSHGGGTGNAAPGTDSQLSTTQSVVDPYEADNYIIKT